MCLVLPGVFLDELDHRSRIFQAVRVMLFVFKDHLDRSAQLFVTVLENLRVFFVGNRLVSCTAGQQDWHPCFGQWLQPIDRADLGGNRFFVGFKAVSSL